MIEDCPSGCIHLIHGPYVTLGSRRRAVPEGSKRLLVLIAVRGQVQRQVAAQLLWPDVEAHRAAGNLRSALWRLRCAELPLLVERDGVLGLGAGVCVDVEVVRGRVAASTWPDHATLARIVDALDLLPGWYEDWVGVERERIRALMLDALDQAAIGLRRAGRCAEAVDAALVAVTADPLRDSSQAALITAHLAEGNVGEARRAYAAYRRLLQEEVGSLPPRRISELVGARPSGSAAQPNRAGQHRRC